MEVKIPNDIASKVLKLLDNTFEQSMQGFKDLARNEANKIEVEMKNRSAVNKGTLKASIGVVQSKKNNNFFWVGPQYSNRNSAFEGGNHGHLLEYGTKERYMKKGLYAGGFTRESGGTKKFSGTALYEPFAGKYTGKMNTSKAFIRPTYDNLGASIIADLKKATETIVKENGRKQGL